MGIRKSSKDHLREHALRDGLALVESPVPNQGPQDTSQDDPLVFWTQHPRKPTRVDLNEFKTGKSERRTRRDEKLFTGRPDLIKELLPAIKDALIVAAPATATQTLTSLRSWFSILDEVESKAATQGNAIKPVASVLDLGPLHQARGFEVLHDTQFTVFRAIVDTTRVALGAKPTFWPSPSRGDSVKHLPPLEQRKALRVAIRHACLKVVDRWAELDEIERLDREPVDAEQAALWRALRHHRAVEQRTGNPAPSLDDLRPTGNANSVQEKFKMTGTELAGLVYPDKTQALAVFTQCMAVTGWNVAVMLGLDIGAAGGSQSPACLFNHPKDERRFCLVGVKDRAGGKEQYAFGQWKSQSMPGYLIRTYLARVEPLRRMLQQELQHTEGRLNSANDRDLTSKDQQKLIKRLTWLRNAVRSPWLYRDRASRVNMLDDDFVCETRRSSKAGTLERWTYLEWVLEGLNRRREQDNKHRAKANLTPLSPIPPVTYGDFRDWFAHEVYTSTFGNVLAVQEALNHAQISTTQRYLNNQILNAQAKQKALEFAEVLTQALDDGQIDLTRMALQVRHGPLTPEHEKRLAELRKLPRSRQNVGCQNPAEPPPHLNATPGKSCDQQRCLLCPQNAVLFPESISGLAMREAELLTMRDIVPMESFIEGLYDAELKNHGAALNGFDAAQVEAERKKWAAAIREGRHVVPGIPITHTAHSDELNLEAQP